MLNNVVLMGRLTADPVLSQTVSGVNVLYFCLAVERRYQQAGSERKSDFINCVAWRGTAEFICKYFSKGDMLAVTGEIQTRQYEEKDTGKKRTVFEVVANDVSFCGSKKQTEAVQETPPAPNGFTFSDEDLPF